MARTPEPIKPAGDAPPPKTGEPGDVAVNPAGGNYSKGHPGVPPKERK